MAVATVTDVRPFPLRTGIATVTAVARITPRMARITLSVVIDVVLHGDGAQASRWGGSVRPGRRRPRLT